MHPSQCYNNTIQSLLNDIEVVSIIPLINHMFVRFPLPLKHHGHQGLEKAAPDLDF